MYSVALVLPSPESDSGQQALASGTHLRYLHTYLLQYSSQKKGSSPSLGAPEVTRSRPTGPSDRPIARY